MLPYIGIILCLLGSAFFSGTEIAYTSLSKLKVKKDGGKCVVTFNIKNTGDRDGEEVAQLYIKFAGDDAAMRLRGFDRVPVAKGETVKVELVVEEEDMKLWDMDEHKFVFDKGEYEFLVGASSSDIRLKTTKKL